MKKYYEILGLNIGANKQEIKKAFNKLSKELDPKKNDNQDFFIEETKKLKEAYDKLMNSSILSNKKINENKQTDDSQKDDKENNEIPLNNKSNFMKNLKEILVAVLSITMIKVITQLLAFPSGYIDFEEIFIILSDSRYSYDFSFIVFLFSVLLYFFLRFVLLMSL